LNQTYDDVECIVIDGASTDGTLKTIKRFEGGINYLISEPDQGIYYALNKGIARATGDVLGFLHSDDYFTDTMVLARVAVAMADPLFDACYGDLCYVDRDDARIRYWHAGQYQRERLAWGWMPPHPTFYARKRVYQQFGVFDTSYRIAADYDCLLRFLITGGIRCVYIPSVLVAMRTGGMSNRSLKNILLKSCEDYRALRSNGVGGLGVLLAKNIRKIGQLIVGA